MSRSTVIITGANRGIGLELVKQFVADGGWQVVAGCRNPDGAAALAALAADADGAVEIMALDVADEQSVQSFAAAMKGRRVDILLNNAGILGGDRQTAFNIDFDAWLETFKVNTMAPLRMVQAVIENLRLSDNPKIVTISSQMGALNLKGGGEYAYRSSKAAVNKVMQVLAQDLKSDGIIVTLYHPGWVQTDMGGPSADLTPAESAAGLFASVTGLTQADSGRFLKWNGEEHAW